MVEWPPSAWNPDGRQKIVCIDTVPPEIDAHYVPEVELIGDLGHILTQLGCLLWDKPMAGYEVPPYRRALSVALDAGSDDDVPIKPQRVLHDLRKAMAPHDVLISNAFGIEGHRVERAGDLLPALTRAFGHKGPVVLDIPIDYAENRKLGVDLWQLTPEMLIGKIRKVDSGG
jgi:thiamine pyrophosphate-dependent acetolactate synthase large subunit-like protein